MLDFDNNYKLNWRTGLVAGYIAFVVFGLMYQATCSRGWFDFCGAYLIMIATIPALFLENLSFLKSISGGGFLLYTYIFNVAFWYFIGWLIDRRIKNKKNKI